MQNQKKIERMIMIKRTPQEIADFFQCYVAMNKNGDWTAFNKKPFMPGGMVQGWYMSSSDNIQYLNLYDFVDSPFNHDWTHLYEPQSGNQGKTEEDFPNHAKEVYTHKEYRIVSAVADTEDLDSKVTKLLNEGWKPIGGVAFSQYDDNHYDTFYQAMVRGV